MKNSLKGIEQGRADYAYRCVEIALQLEKKSSQKSKLKTKEYKSYTKKIPMMIKINGLGNTFGFIKSKSSGNIADINNIEKINKLPEKYNAYDLLYQQISNYLYEEKRYLFVKQETTPSTETLESELLKQIIQLETPEYRAITHELLALFSWLKRFSEGLIKDKEDTAEKEDA